VIFIINGKEYSLTKANASRYPYFQYMFKYSHNPEEHRYEITIMKMEEKIIGKLVDFIEEGKFSLTPNGNKNQLNSRLVNLAYLCDYFGVEDLKVKVEAYLCEHMPNCNNLESILLANLLGMSTFERHCCSRYLRSINSE
jgi:hypothetical protein